MKSLYNCAGCSSPFNKKIRKFSFSEGRFTHRLIRTHAKSDTKPPFARSISTYRVVFQPPGLKSDILHENSPTYRRQPFTSSHIIALSADQSRTGTRWSHTSQSRKYYYTVFSLILQEIFYFIDWEFSSVFLFKFMQLAQLRVLTNIFPSLPHKGV